MNLSRVYDIVAPLYRFFLEFPLFGLKKEQVAALPWVEGEKILDIGCGTGYLLSRIAREERSVVGLDISPGMLAQACKRLSREGKKARLVRGNYCNLPFNDFSFECILATFALTHAPRLKPVIAEISRVLSPGGRLVIVDVGPSFIPSCGSKLLTLLWRLIGDHARDESPYLESAGFCIVHRRELTKLGTVHIIVAEKPSSFET